MRLLCGWTITWIQKCRKLTYMFEVLTRPFAKTSSCLKSTHGIEESLKKWLFCRWRNCMNQNCNYLYNRHPNYLGKHPDESGKVKYRWFIRRIVFTCPHVTAYFNCRFLVYSLHGHIYLKNHFIFFMVTIHKTPFMTQLFNFMRLQIISPPVFNCWSHPLDVLYKTILSFRVMTKSGEFTCHYC